MWKRLKGICSNSQLWRRVAMTTAFGLLIALAFVWGRFGAGKSAAQQTTRSYRTSTQRASDTDYANRVVAYIYGDKPITRQELGEYLIARHGAERLKFLVHRRIVEMACAKAGIFVTNEEVNARFEEDLKAFKMTDPKEFQKKILSRWNKSVYEWREDVIRPKLALTKLCRSRVKVTDTDLRKAFEARYGPKVQCRMIVLPQKVGQQKFQIWKDCHDEAKFAEYASKQFMTPIAAKHGKVPPIHRHFGDKRIEKAAFNLRVGQLSELLEMPDGTVVILKCDGRIPPDTTKRFEEERESLYNEVFEHKLNRMIPETFRALKQAAQPRIFEDEVTPRGSIRVARRRPRLIPQIGRPQQQQQQPPQPRQQRPSTFEPEYSTPPKSYPGATSAAPEDYSAPSEPVVPPSGPSLPPGAVPGS